jgi:hypothetical protein
LPGPKPLNSRLGIAKFSAYVSKCAEMALKWAVGQGNTHELLKGDSRR